MFAKKDFRSRISVLALFCASLGGITHASAGDGRGGCPCDADLTGGAGDWEWWCNAEQGGTPCSTRDECENGQECVRCAPPPDGVVNFTDLFAMIEAATGANTYSCGDADFDVNCDGRVDFEDLGTVVCVFQMGFECCGAPPPIGACCKPSGPCLETTEQVCLMDEPPGIGVGDYLGDDTTCSSGPCDCIFDSIPDYCDVDCSIPGCSQPCGWAKDCNGNLQPDRCEIGACCITDPEGLVGCTTDLKANCDAANGVWRGPCVQCPEQNAAIVEEPDGDVVIHVIGAPSDCPPEGPIVQVSRANCTTGPYVDVWVSNTSGIGRALTCHNFGSASTDPIPADFFGPGSDPFEGIVCYRSVPLGMPEYGNADTLVERSADPFDRCDMTLNAPSTVDVDVVALSLASDAPITVTYSGGPDEQWDVALDLSPNGLLPGTPQGTLTATKRHCNGGTYTSLLYVQPRFTFTKVGDPGATEILDTFDSGTNAISLHQPRELWWVSDLDLNTGIIGDNCTDFHPSVIQVIQSTNCQPPADCFLSSPSPAPPPHDIPKNRYISIQPGNLSVPAFDIRLELISTLVNGVDAGQIGSRSWANAPDANCISIVGPGRPIRTPSWGACPTVHLTGCPIIPTSIYDIVTAGYTTVSDPPLSTETQAKPGAKWYGDCVGFFTGTEWTAPNGQASIDDAVAAIKTFQNPSNTPGCGTPPCNATHTSVTDMVPNLTPGPQINKIVNIADVFSIIQGFQGFEYPGPEVELCDNL